MKYFACPYCKLRTLTAEQAKRHAYRCSPTHPHYVEWDCASKTVGLPAAKEH